MAEGARPQHVYNFNLNVETLNLEELNTGSVNVRNIIREQHVTRTNIDRSHINNMTLNVVSGGEEVEHEHFEKETTENQHDSLKNVTPGNHKDWTELSSNILIYNKQTLRPHAEVYRGQQKHISGRVRDVVVKILKDTENCTREVDFLLKLSDHPNIVKILESGKCESTIPQIFIVMELCLQNLNEYIKENPFSLQRAVVFFQQTVSAIVFIHDNRIAHRDLKPSNILITLDGENIKVSDFGISREISHDHTHVTVTHPGAGTEGFKAPETYLGKPQIGYKTDIYSLAICGCIIITHGVHPFGGNPYMWVANIITNKYVHLNAIPKFPEPNMHKRTQLIDLIKKMLKPDPKNRPTALQVQQDVFFKDNNQSAGTKKARTDSERFGARFAKKSVRPSKKFLEASKLVERAIVSNSDKVLESIRIFRESVPKSYTADDVITLSRSLSQEGQNIQSLILLRIANEIFHTRHPASDVRGDKLIMITWIDELVDAVLDTASQLKQSRRESQQIYIDYGYNYVKELLADFRREVNISEDVRAVCEARCLVCLTAFSIGGLEDYEATIRYCEEGVACLEGQFHESADEYKFYGWLLNNSGVAHDRLRRNSDAERYYARALEVYKRATYENETERTKNIERVENNIWLLRARRGKYN